MPSRCATEKCSSAAAEVLECATQSRVSRAPAGAVRRDASGNLASGDPSRPYVGCRCLRCQISGGRPRQRFRNWSVFGGSCHIWPYAPVFSPGLEPLGGSTAPAEVLESASRGARVPTEPVYREHRRERSAAACDLDTALRASSTSSVWRPDRLNLRRVISIRRCAATRSARHSAGINPNAAN